MPWKEYNVMSQRFEFVIRSFTPNVNFTDLCAEFGVSTKTGYKWKERFIKEGINGLKDKPRAPRSNASKLPEDIICEIIRIKTLKPKWGPKKILKIFSKNNNHQRIPARSSVERILLKAGLVTKKRRRKQNKTDRIQNRITPEKPNDLWTVDFKGWWYTPTKEKCEPLTIRDEFSKFIFTIKILQKGNIPCVKREFERIFSKYGLPLMIRSDNGPPFASSMSLFGLTKLSVWWLSLGITLDRIDPASPYQNGSHERMHRDIKEELEGKINGNLKLHQRIFDVWKDEYNNERPHEALGMKTPSEVYRKSKSNFNGTVFEIIYPSGYLPRRVNDRGLINYKGRRIFISNAFSNYYVGLQVKGKSFIVWFDNHQVGEIDLKSYMFHANKTL